MLERIPGAVEELPPPSATLVLLATFAQAYLQTLPRKERKTFLQHADALMAQHAILGNVAPLRPASQLAELDAERLKAAAWWHRVRPAFEALARR